VILDRNGRTKLAVQTTQTTNGKQLLLKIINNNSNENIDTELYDGECFFFTINALLGVRRGRSDLLASFDWIDAYEQFLFGELERANMSRAFIWDITLKGATAAEVNARANEIKSPKPGSARIHNDSEEWKVESPELKSFDSAEAARLFRNHILAANTIPEHWIGGGGDGATGRNGGGSATSNTGGGGGGAGGSNAGGGTAKSGGSGGSGIVIVRYLK
jgi:hypothetical protein